MKKFKLFIIMFFVSVSFYGQAPQKINYQAVVRDGNGNILPNTAVPITIDVINGVNTCAVYSGSQTTNSYGLINIELDLSACTIDWSTGTATLSSSINSVSGTSDLNSVPYSLHANTVTNYPSTGNTDGDILVWDATNGQWMAQQNSSSQLPVTANTDDVLTWNGSAWVAQVNDGFEANTDEQLSTGVILDPPADFNNDQIDETNVHEALLAIQGELSNNTSSKWVNSTDQGYETSVILQDNLANVGVGTTAPDVRLQINGNVLAKNTSQYGTKISIENDEALGTSSLPENAATLELINNDIQTSGSYSHFEISNVKYDDGANNPLQLEEAQDEFKIRRNISYDPSNPQPNPPTFTDYLTIEGEELEIGVLTDNPHATLSTKGNMAVGTNYAVYDASTEDNITLPTSGLIVEGNTGLGTMEPQSKLDVRGSVRIGSGYSGDATITTDPTDGIIVEGTVGIGTDSPNTNYKLDVDGKVHISTNATDGGVLKIGSASQTSGDAVLINGVNGLNALKINAGNTYLAGELDVISDFRINTDKFTVSAATGNTSILGELDVVSDFRINTDKFSISGASGNTLIAGTLDVANSTSLSNTLLVSGSTTLGSTLEVNGNTSILGDLDINTDKFTVESSSGNSAIGGTLAVTGNTTINSALSVNDQASIIGDFSVNTDKFIVESSSGNTSMAGALDMNSNLISNVTDPSSSQDAATKNYVDNSITNNALSAGNDIVITNNEIILEDDIDLNHVRAATSSGLNLTDFSGNGIFVQNGGNVGIGVSNPRNIIDINGIGGLILDYYQSDIDQAQNCSGCTGHVALESSGTNPLNWETIYSTSNSSFQDGSNRLSVTVTVPSNGKIILEAKTYLQVYNCSDHWGKIYGRIIDENNNIVSNSTQRLIYLSAFVVNDNGTNNNNYENSFSYNSYIEYEFLISNLTAGDTKTFTYQMAGKSSGTDIMRLEYSNELKYTIKAITAP